MNEPNSPGECIVCAALRNPDSEAALVTVLAACFGQDEAHYALDVLCADHATAVMDEHRRPTFPP